MAAKKGKGDGITKKWHKDAKCFNCDETGYILGNCPKPQKRKIVSKERGSQK
jgi:hypothetical protein